MFAAVLPVVAGSLVAVLVPLGVVLASVAVTTLRHTDQRSHEQLLPLRLPSRAS